MSDRQKFSSQAAPKLLEAMRSLAKRDGRHFQALLEEALEEYLERRNSDSPRESVMSHLRDSVRKNHRLGELLAK